MATFRSGFSGSSGGGGGGGGAPTGPAGGDLAGTYPNPQVAAITEAGGPTQLPIGTIGEGELLRVVGGQVVGAIPVGTLGHRYEWTLNGSLALAPSQATAAEFDGLAATDAGLDAAGPFDAPRYQPRAATLSLDTLGVTVRTQPALDFYVEFYRLRPGNPVELVGTVHYVPAGADRLRTVQAVPSAGDLTLQHDDVLFASFYAPAVLADGQDLVAWAYCVENLIP